MNEIELNIKDAFLKYLEYVDKLVEENKELRKEIKELKEEIVETKELLLLESENQMTCKEICYQQWVDNYNKKDKECFDLQLKCSKLEQKLEKIKEYCIPDLMFTECMKTILQIIETEVIK